MIYEFMGETFVKKLKELSEVIPLVEMKKYNDILISFNQKPLERMTRGDAKVMAEVIEAQTACKNCMPSECPIKGIRVFPLVVNGRIVPDMYMCQLYLNTVYIQRVMRKRDSSLKAKQIVQKAEEVLGKEVYYFTIEECKEVLAEIERRDKGEQ